MLLAAELAVRITPRQSFTHAVSAGDDATRRLGVRITSLQTLELGGSQTSAARPLLAAGALALASALRLNRSELTYLDLSRHRMDPKGAKQIGAALEHNTVLRTLLLEGNRMGSEAAQVFARALLLNSTLTVLSLRENAMGVEAAIALTAAFQQHPSLLSLTHLLVRAPRPTVLEVHLACDDCYLFAAELPADKTLVRLTLSLPSSAAGAIIAIADALRTNATLRSLGISGGGLNAEAAEALGASLRVNATLTDLRLRHNNLGAVGVRAITTALLVNSTLTSVDVAFNGVPRQSAADVVCDQRAIERFRADHKAGPLRLST